MTKKKGLLVRVGIDQSFGGYNAPINPITNDFLYMPIPQGSDDYMPGARTSYDDLVSYFEKWKQKNNAIIEFPKDLYNVNTHLDPDYDYLTYGDQATGRGLRVDKLKQGDFIAFFASFRPTSKSNHKLIYALFGLMTVDKVLKVAEVPEDEFHANAHTRIINRNKDHLVVFADLKVSGRFNKALPIGEFRNGSYRVKNEILDLWGGIGVKDGFIQRSINPPWFNKPEQFLEWLKCQKIKLINSNWK